MEQEFFEVRGNGEDWEHGHVYSSSLPVVTGVLGLEVGLLTCFRKTLASLKTLGNWAPMSQAAPICHNIC